MRVCLVVMLSLLNAFFLHAFVRTGGRARSKPAVSSTLPDAHLRRVLNLQMNLNKPDVSKAQILMKKKKIQEVQLVKDEIFDGGQEHPVNVFLKTGDRGAQIKNPINFFNHTNVISTGCLSVLSEYNKKTETGFITGMPPPEIMGGVLRDAGSRAIIISMDKRSGGSSCEDFKRFAIEQSRAKMYMPSPLPLVWHDFVVDAVQISQAASLGASAITLYPDFTDSTISTDSTEGEKRERGGGGGGNDLESLVRHAKSLDVEPIGMADSVYNAKIALDAGIRCVCLYLMSEKELVEAREELPDTTSCGQPIMYSGRLRPETDYSSYAEIDSAWVLRVRLVIVLSEDGYSFIMVLHYEALVFFHHAL